MKKDSPGRSDSHVPFARIRANLTSISTPEAASAVAPDVPMGQQPNIGFTQDTESSIVKTRYPKLRSVMATAAALAAISTAFWWTWDHFASHVPVEVIAARATSVPDLLPVSGLVVSKRQVDLPASQTGQLYRVFVEGENLVKRGEILATLDNREALINVHRAETQIFRYRIELDSAEKELRAQKSNTDAIKTNQVTAEPQSNLAMFKSRLMAAEADLAGARLAVDRLAILAPFTGLVIRSSAIEGRWVEAGETLYTIADLDSLEIAISIRIDSNEQIRPGDSIRFKTGGDTSPWWTEKVSRSTDDISSSKVEAVQRRGVVAYATLSDNAPRLMLNQRLEGEAITDKTRNAIVIPIEALVEHNGQKSVALVQYGKVHFVPVSTGRREGTQVEVTAGISAGDLLVMPRQALEDGQRVTATELNLKYSSDLTGYPHRVEYPNVPTLSTLDLAKQYDNIVIVDLRDRFAFNIAHVAKAINLPYAAPNFIEQLKDLRSKYSDKPIVVYCDDRACATSYEAAQVSQRGGLRQIIAYDGGLAEWIQASPQRTALLGQSPMTSDRLVSDEYLQARLLDKSGLAERIHDPDAVLIQLGDPASNADLVAAGAITLTPEEFAKKLAGGNFRDKELLITGLESGQARWLQYLLENDNHKNYMFVAKPANRSQPQKRKS